MTHPLFGGISTGRSLAAKLYQLGYMIERLHIPVANLGGRPAIEQATAEALADIESRLETIAARITSAPKKQLDGPDLWKQSAIAMVAIARDRCSVRANAADLKELVVAQIGRHVPSERRTWEAFSAEKVWGLYEHEGIEAVVVNARSRPGEIFRLVQPEGVIFWSEERDRHLRIVDTRWLQSHADMFRWVVEPWPGGRRCRFCGMTESPVVDALFPVELERRHGRTTIGDVVVLDAGASAHTHLRCREHWLRVLTTIAPYNSLAQARAADQAAGRSSRFGSARTVQASAQLLAAPAKKTATGADGHSQVHDRKG